jgi:hypothetical protein
MQAEMFSITARHKGNLSAPAALSDFTLQPGAGAADLLFSPYALVPDRGAVAETGTPAAVAPGQRPFFYLDQYEDSTALRLTPVRDYMARADGIAPRGRVFVFSTGRAGSTLVSKILAAARIPSVSEPDVLLGLGQRASMDKLGIGKPGWNALYRACISELETRFGSPETIAFKFRAQSSNRFHARSVHRLFPDATFCFVFRNVADWSRSFVTKFGFQADTLKWLLTENLHSAAMLTRLGARVRVLRYEDIVQQPDLVLQGVADPQAIASAGLDAVLGRDSQEGMFAGPDAGRDSDAAQAALQQQQAFLDWWQENRPAGRLAGLGLDL